jgi:hypothetical protein
MRKINSLNNILSGLKKKDSEPGLDLKEFTIVLKNKQTKQSFIDDMESQSTNILSGTIPSRSCKSLIPTNNNNRRVLKYKLTKEEANLLEKDSRVECVEQYVEKKIKPLGFGDKTKLLKPFDYLEKKDHEHEIKIQSLDQYATISGLPDGADVDVVVVDGFVPPNNPEFANNPDGSGGSRVNQINWYEIINYTHPVYPSYPYLSYITDDEDINANNNHGCHVSGTISGNTQGWAKKSNIYNAYPYVSLFYDEEQNIDLLYYAIKTWHENKDINDLYSNKNPTITNHSYGMSYNGLWDIRNILSINYRGSTITPQRNYSGAQLSSVLNDSGGIQQVNVVNQGTNYTNEPTISFYGGGQAEAVAEMANNSVKKIVITDGGSNYDRSNPPTITFSEPPAGGVRATGTIVSERFLYEDGSPVIYISDGYDIGGDAGIGGVYFVELTEAGSGYTSPPTVTFSNPTSGGRVAQAYTELGSNFIKKINITNGGTGYNNDLSVPFVILSGGNPSQSADISIGPVAYAGDLNFTDSNGSLLNGIYEPYATTEQSVFEGPVSIYSYGGVYSSQPTVSFYDGNAWLDDGTVVGTKPHLRAVMGTDADEGKVVSVDIVRAGSGYTSPPNIVITDGGGFTADQLKNYGMVVYYNTFPQYLNRLFVANIPARDAATDSELQDLMDSGAIVVCAAGNDYYKIDTNSGQDYNNYVSVIDFPRLKAESSILNLNENIININYNRGSSPGSCPGVICVGATEVGSTEYKTDFSSTGPRVDVYAPGDYINSSTYTDGLPDPRNNDYCIAKFSGTSMASPQVSGMLACYAQNNRTINQLAAYNFIVDNARPTVQNGTGYQNLQGGTNKYAYFPGISYQ